jgi:hypothetical protein
MTDGFRGRARIREGEGSDGEVTDDGGPVFKK